MLLWIIEYIRILSGFSPMDIQYTFDIRIFSDAEGTEFLRFVTSANPRKKCTKQCLVCFHYLKLHKFRTCTHYVFNTVCCLKVPKILQKTMTRIREIWRSNKNQQPSTKSTCLRNYGNYVETITWLSPIPPLSFIDR